MRLVIMSKNNSDKIQAKWARRMDEGLQEVMPHSWDGHRRLAEDDYPYDE